MKNLYSSLSVLMGSIFVFAAGYMNSHIPVTIIAATLAIISFVWLVVDHYNYVTKNKELRETAAKFYLLQKEHLEKKNKNPKKRIVRKRKPRATTKKTVIKRKPAAKKPTTRKPAAKKTNV